MAFRFAKDDRLNTRLYYRRLSEDWVQFTFFVDAPYVIHSTYESAEEHRIRISRRGSAFYRAGERLFCDVEHYANLHSTAHPKLRVRDTALLWAVVALMWKRKIQNGRSFDATLQKLADPGRDERKLSIVPRLVFHT